jgi:hypothetical protein
MLGTWKLARAVVRGDVNSIDLQDFGAEFASGLPVIRPQLLPGADLP